MDCVAHEGEVVVMAISEHVENAGTHSGDATLVLPPQDLNQQTIDNIEVVVYSIARALNVSGNNNNNNALQLLLFAGSNFLICIILFRRSI